MKIGVYVLALAPFFFIGCAEEPTTVTTTKTTRDVTTTGPATTAILPPLKFQFSTVALRALRCFVHPILPNPSDV